MDTKSGYLSELAQLLHDVRNLQSKQTSLSDKLSYMQTENQALWGEIGLLRQKHSKQQQIVSKLMQFLLNFIASNSQHHDPSVTKESKETLTNDLGQLHHSNTPPLVLGDAIMSPNSLKRKQVALMHADEPNKRTANQQQPPPGFGRQQSVTINELSDHDSQAWAHATAATTPLVDFVPSPLPAPIQHVDDQNFIHSQPTQTSVNIGNGDHLKQTFEPDFILRTDHPAAVASTHLAPPSLSTNPVDIKTFHASPTKQVDQNDISNAQPHIDALIDPIKAAPTLAAALFSPNQEAPTLAQTNQPVSFSLDDITGDVDHIQASLDNIRDFMFDSLPEGASIEDLFGENNELLSPLLHAAANPLGNTNQLAANVAEQQLLPTDNPQINPSQQQQILVPPTIPEAAVPSHTYQPVTNMNNQLLQQLIHEKATVQEQQQHIHQLEKAQSDLKDKILILEQQAQEKYQQ